MRKTAEEIAEDQEWKEREIKRKKEDALHKKMRAKFDKLDYFKNFMLENITMPKGFTGTFNVETWSWQKPPVEYHSYVISNDDITIRFDQSGCGHTRFKAPDGSWRSYDRTGVEDSFYWLPWHGIELQPLDEIIMEQLDRIAKSLEYYKTAITIPQVGFTTSPEGLVKLKNDLKTKRMISFHPSGFGTGYTISTKRLQYSERVKLEVEKFFEISPLYIYSFDCD